jgi:hypothetical protein
MTIFTVAAGVIVIGWFALTALFWTSFNEDERVHPIYRSGVVSDPMRRDDSASNSAEFIKGETYYCKCNIAGDRPKRPVYVDSGRTFCARCEKPVNLCSRVGVSDCGNGAHAA